MQGTNDALKSLLKIYLERATELGPWMQYDNNIPKYLRVYLKH